MALVGIMTFVVVLVAILLAFPAIEARRDRPQRIGRKDAQALLAEAKTLRALVNDIDVEARAEQQVNSNNIFAGHVANKIAATRKELNA